MIISGSATLHSVGIQATEMSFLDGIGTCQIEAIDFCQGIGTMLQEWFHQFQKTIKRPHILPFQGSQRETNITCIETIMQGVDVVHIQQSVHTVGLRIIEKMFSQKPFLRKRITTEVVESLCSNQRLDSHLRCIGISAFQNEAFRLQFIMIGRCSFIFFF